MDAVLVFVHFFFNLFSHLPSTSPFHQPLSSTSRLKLTKIRLKTTHRMPIWYCQTRSTKQLTTWIGDCDTNTKYKYNLMMRIVWPSSKVSSSSFWAVYGNRTKHCSFTETEPIKQNQLIYLKQGRTSG